MRTRSDAGFLEIILITALLILFGATTFTLVSSGGDAYRRVMDKRETGITLRVAMSYLTTQLRQNDLSGAVLLTETDTGDCLTLRREIGGEIYETSIYMNDGWLYEALIPEGLPLEPEYGSPITPLTGFSCRYLDDGRALLLTVTASRGDSTQSRESVISLHSNAG